MANKVWFITGASKGLGLSLAQKLLAQGHRVAATSRSEAALIKVLGNRSERFLPLEVDLLDEKSVRSAVLKAVESFKGLDVVVNNAGYGQFGTVEEVSDAEARTNYDVNVFGALNVVRQVLPFMREKRAGQIFNISSIGGFVGGFPGVGIYCSSKFALAGLTEALRADLEPFNVKVSLVYPGYFRTNFLDKNSMALPQNPIAAYELGRGVVTQHTDVINNNQPGDPSKAADALIKVAASSNPPLHLFLGKDSVAMAKAKLDAVKADIEAWEELSTSTDF